MTSFRRPAPGARDAAAGSPRVAAIAALTAVALVATIALTPARAQANSSGLDVDIAAPDGFPLKGTYFAADSSGPGILLLHQCNRTRRSYDGAAKALASAGFHVLTLDFRGFGESTGEGNADFRSQSEELWARFDGDVDRALEFLESMPEVDEERIGAMGASCGGSQVLLMATRHPEVRAAVFLSSSLPWIEEEDLVAFEANRPIPILGIAAEGDRRTAERTRRLFESSDNPASRLVLYKGELHGVPLFDHDPALLDAIVSFFEDRL